MKFSIITINLNNREGLRRTMESVLSQTFSDFEYIIIDGGSTDGSMEVIEQYKDRLTYFHCKPDAGIYNAMNKGIEKSHGEYLNFMNSGDTFYDAATLQHVADYDLRGDVVYGDWLRVYPDHKVFKASPHDVSLSFFYQKNICHQAMFIKRELHKQHPYDERFQILGDWAMWQKFAFEDRTFQYIPLTICCFEAGTGKSEDPLLADRRSLEVGWTHDDFPQSVNALLAEHQELESAAGYRLLPILRIRHHHPWFNRLMKICLAPAYIIAHLFYKKELEERGFAPSSST